MAERKFISYLRVSTDKQGRSGLGIEAQREAVASYLNGGRCIVGWFLRSIEANRNYPLAHFWFANALALLGSLDQARAAANAGLALDPSFTICRFRDGGPSDNPTFLAKRERVIGGLRLAGVPEG